MAVYRPGCDSAVGNLSRGDIHPYLRSTNVILRFYNSSMARVRKSFRNNNGVFLKALLCRTTFFRHGFKYKVDSLTAEPKPPLLIPKRLFRNSNEGTLSCFIENFLYYCRKCLLYYVK